MRMNVARIAYFISVVASLGFASSAFAQVNMQLTGVGQGNVMAGVYTSPYTGTINGVSASIICDDFTDDTFLKESWQATQLNVATLGATKFDYNQQTSQALPAQKQDYDAAAALAIQLLNTNNSTTMGYLSYAIWDIFNDAAVSAWLASHGGSNIYNQAHSLATQYLAKNYSSGQYLGVSFSNVNIYTPIPNTASGCPTTPCQANSPQEFLTVTTPEASTPVVLAGDLLVLLAVVVLFRRRTIQAAK